MLLNELVLIMANVTVYPCPLPCRGWSDVLLSTRVNVSCNLCCNYPRFEFSQK